MSLAEILKLLLPQLILLLSALVIMVVDLIDGSEKKRWAPFVGLAGIVGAMIAAGSAWGSDISILGGMLRIDPYGIIFSELVLAGTGLTILAAISYMHPRTPYRAEFYAFLLFVALAMTLLVGAGNLIMVFVAMETLSIASYILVGYLREDKKSNEAAIKYFLYGAISSAIMLYGMSLLYGTTGTADLKEIATYFYAGVPEGVRWIAFPATILLLAGFGFKVALVPFHQWSPDTYEGAPTPITAFLSVGSKAAGFAILARVFLEGLPPFQADWSALLAGIAMVTMTVGNLTALRQTNIKRMLAYSSIAHAGYILIGLVCVTPASDSPFNGLNGMLVYLIAYLFTNMGAFMTVIAVEESTGSNTISDFSGLFRRSPWLAGSMLVFLLSLIGIPATGGFIGKLFVFGAAIQVQFYLLAIVAIVNSAISVYYYLNVVRYMFFTGSPEETNAAISVPAGVRWVGAICLIMTFVIGLYPQPFVQLASASSHLLASL